MIKLILLFMRLDIVFICFFLVLVVSVVVRVFVLDVIFGRKVWDIIKRKWLNYRL